jgi:hypothetical protein
MEAAEPIVRRRRVRQFRTTEEKRLIVEQTSLPSGRYQTSALSEWVTPHLAISQTVRLEIDRGELLEFDFCLSKPRNDTPAHHHQFTFTCLTITPDDGLHTVRCDVVVRARKDDILKIPTDVEMLGYQRSHP